VPHCDVPGVHRQEAPLDARRIREVKHPAAAITHATHSNSVGPSVASVHAMQGHRTRAAPRSTPVSSPWASRPAGHRHPPVGHAENHHHRPAERRQMCVRHRDTEHRQVEPSSAPSQCRDDVKQRCHHDVGKRQDDVQPDAPGQTRRSQSVPDANTHPDQRSVAGSAAVPTMSCTHPRTRQPSPQPRPRRRRRLRGPRAASCPGRGARRGTAPRGSSRRFTRASRGA
jgi:hypothetical protein